MKTRAESLLTNLLQYTLSLIPDSNPHFLTGYYGFPTMLGGRCLIHYATDGRDITIS